MADENLLDSLGLSYTTLFSTHGKLAEKNMSTILSNLALSSSVNVKTRAELAKGFNLWSTGVEDALRFKVLEQFKDDIYQLIHDLAIVEDTGDPAGYTGAVFVAATLAETMQNAGLRDSTQALSSQFAPLAYAAADKILEYEANLTFAVVTPFNATVTAATCRTDVCCSLVSTLPYKGNITLSHGMKVLAKILRGSYPARLQQLAKSSISSLTNVAKDSVAHAGAELIQIAEQDSPDLLMSFISMPELYANNPDVVHSHLALFLQQPYMMYCSLYYRIGQVHPNVLSPHLTFFLNQLTQTPAMGSVTLLVLEAMASQQPDAVYAKLDTILAACTTLSNTAASLAKLLGVVGSTASSPEAAPKTLQHLVHLLESDATARPICLAEICNVMKALRTVDPLRALLDSIAKHRTVSETAYTAIADFVAGRSLESLTSRVDEIDERVSALNSRVSQTCHNMADVIAYVDANMADMKDFLAQVCKKLPQPRRLEVIGRVHKSLVLHFACCHTGREFPITSYEWSKWLKMGFSLVKAGQAVIDVGLGNPLGLLSKGVECVRDIYTAYRSKDDDEFDTYITQPFLTSAEQDQLIEKLRAQRFFEVFAYDAQCAGWYLVHPQRDGREADGEAGEVTHLSTKEGHGVRDKWIEAAKDLAEAVVGREAVDMLSVELPVRSAASRDEEAKQQDGREGGERGDDRRGGAAGGGRAAALREQLQGGGSSGVEDNRMGEVGRPDAYSAKMDGLERQVQALERDVRRLCKEVEQLKARPAGCACIIA